MTMQTTARTAYTPAINQVLCTALIFCSPYGSLGSNHSPRYLENHHTQTRLASEVTILVRFANPEKTSSVHAESSSSILSRKQNCGGQMRVRVVVVHENCQRCKEQGTKGRDASAHKRPCKSTTQRLYRVRRRSSVPVLLDNLATYIEERKGRA
jgi:hypothetical protein